jgi:hypothetical protein
LPRGASRWNVGNRRRAGDWRSLRVGVGLQRRRQVHHHDGGRGGGGHPTRGWSRRRLQRRGKAGVGARQGQRDGGGEGLPRCRPALLVVAGVVHCTGTPASKGATKARTHTHPHTFACTHTHTRACTCTHAGIQSREMGTRVRTRCTRRAQHCAELTPAPLQGPTEYNVIGEGRYNNGGAAHREILQRRQQHQ